MKESYWESLKGQCDSNYISHTWSESTLNFVKIEGTNGNICIFIKIDQFFQNGQSRSNHIARDWFFFSDFARYFGKCNSIRNTCAFDKIGQGFVKG